jgi:hypothetical protein
VARARRHKIGANLTKRNRRQWGYEPLPHAGFPA